MRGGRTIATRDPRGMTGPELTELVVGAALPTQARRRTAGAAWAAVHAPGRPCRPARPRPGSAGEIVGLAGVGGNGQSELMEALTGLRAPLGGCVMLDGVGDIAARTPHQRCGLGIAVIPADRAAFSLAGPLSITENYAVGGLLDGCYGRLRRRRMRDDAQAAVREFALQGVRGLGQKAALLSGGNAQKLVLAREFAGRPRLVLAHSPCRGLDVHAADVLMAPYAVTLGVIVWTAARKPGSAAEPGALGLAFVREEQR